MNNTTIYVKEKLQAITLAEMEKIAEAINVPFNTLKRIRYQAVVDPRGSTLMPVYDYFKSRE